MEAEAGWKKGAEALRRAVEDAAAVVAESFQRKWVVLEPRNRTEEEALCVVENVADSGALGFEGAVDAEVHETRDASGAVEVAEDDVSHYWAGDEDATFLPGFSVLQVLDVKEGRGVLVGSGGDRVGGGRVEAGDEACVLEVVSAVHVRLSSLVFVCLLPFVCGRAVHSREGSWSQYLLVYTAAAPPRTNRGLALARRSIASWGPTPTRHSKIQTFSLAACARRRSPLSGKDTLSLV